VYAPLNLFLFWTRLVSIYLLWKNYEKRKMEAEVQEFKTRLDEEYNQLLLRKALEAKKGKT